MIETENFKKKLLDEKALLETELSSIGRRNPENKDDWEAKSGNVEISTADQTDAGDAVEEFETNKSVLDQLEVRYREVEKALKRIEDGSYGVCEISGNPIETERLEANPAARTCIAMKDRENELR